MKEDLVKTSLKQQQRGAHHIQQDIRLGELMEQGLLLEGHFDYGNGYHGSSYLCAQPIFEQPYKIMEYAHRLKDQLPSETLKLVDIVVAPITGGVLLGVPLAIAIDNDRSPKDRRVLFAPVYKTNGELRLREHYRKRIKGDLGELRGLNALVVDDVCNTGRTINATRALVASCGGHVLASVVLYDRQVALDHLMNHYALDHVEVDPEFCKAEECICQTVPVPITRF